MVVIPDLWGKFSDALESALKAAGYVVIPDLWGKFSDKTKMFNRLKTLSRNPRFVGQVFRLHPVKKFHYFQILKKVKKG